MKKLIAAFTLVLLGAGCVWTAKEEITVEKDQSAQDSDGGFVRVAWFYDEYLSQVCLDGGTAEMSPSIAADISYPNQETDHLCVSDDTANRLVTNPSIDDTGEADVKLANLELVSDVYGRIYLIDVVEVDL